MCCCSEVCGILVGVSVLLIISETSVTNSV